MSGSVASDDAKATNYKRPLEETVAEDAKTGGKRQSYRDLFCHTKGLGHCALQKGEPM